MANETDQDPRYPGTGNYIDWLMSLDPLELSARNIDEVVLFQRKSRLAYDSGAKPKRGASGPPISLADIGLVKKSNPVKRRKV